MRRPPHEVLGIPPNATREAAREAYRALARRWHPDREGGDAAVFAEVSEAYEKFRPRGRGYAKLMEDFDRAVREPAPAAGSVTAIETFQFGGKTYTVTRDREGRFHFH